MTLLCDSNVSTLALVSPESSGLCVFLRVSKYHCSVVNSVSRGSQTHSQNFCNVIVTIPQMDLGSDSNVSSELSSEYGKTYLLVVPFKSTHSLGLCSPNAVFFVSCPMLVPSSHRRITDDNAVSRPGTEPLEYGFNRSQCRSRFDVYRSTITSPSTADHGPISHNLRATKTLLRRATFDAEYVWNHGSRRIG